MKIIRATANDVESVLPLFNAYRKFYEQPGDLELAREFIYDRLANNESTIFLALINDEPKGFTQLYPSFCSVEMIKILVLYDLFVDQSVRKTGVGYALLDQARQEANEIGASRIDLQTAQDNFTAQGLYKKFGYQHSDEFQNWSYYLIRENHC